MLVLGGVRFEKLFSGLYTYLCHKYQRKIILQPTESFWITNILIGYPRHGLFQIYSKLYHAMALVI